MGGAKKEKKPFAPEMTEEEIAEAMEKLFGKGTKKSRAEDALPQILEEIGRQRVATLAGLPTVEGFGQGVLPMLQGGFQAPTATPSFGQP